jgi:GntR family transcriptional regulator/MocR family aminotransferase
MRHLYDRRRQALVQALNQYLGEKVQIFGENAGIHLMARITSPISDREIIEGAAKLGVGLVSTANYYLQDTSQGEFLFGYSELDEAQIDEGIYRLSQAIEFD